MIQLEKYRKFVVASVFPVAAVIIDAVTAADFTSTSGLITFGTAILVALGVYQVPNKTA